MLRKVVKSRVACTREEWLSARASILRGAWNERAARDVCDFNLSSRLVSEKLAIDVLFVYRLDF